MKYLVTQEINGYKIEKHVVRKQVSDLYLAHDANLDRPVFLEILQTTAEENAEVADQFRQRMETVARVQHPNLATVFDINTTDAGHPYAAIEYVDGESLAAWAGKSPHSVIEVLQLVRQIVEVLTIAHPLGIVHHHLRPENIIIREGDAPVLIDLGTPSAPTVPDSDETSTDTVDYASPEQLRGNTATNRSNIYSVGIILYELLCGHRPRLSVSQGGSAGPLPQVIPLEEVRPELTIETYRLVRNCLWWQEENRFDTVSELIAAIDVAIAAERKALGGVAIAPGSRRLPYIAAALLLIPLLLAFFLLLRQGDNNQGQTEAIPIGPGDFIPPLQARGNIEVLGPASGSEFSSSGAVTFDWIWTTPLEPDQRFAVQLLSEDGVSTIGVVDEPIIVSGYRLQVESSDITTVPGVYEWQVVLELTSSGEDLAESEVRSIAFLTDTPTPLPSPTPSATSIISTTPTVTATSTPTSTGTATPTPDCRPAPPPGWVLYTVRFGDSLSPLAVQTGTIVSRLVDVNCLDTIILSVGQRLWLPSLPVTDTPVPVNTVASPPTAPPGGGTQPPTEPPSDPPPGSTQPPPPTQPPPTEPPPTSTPPPPPGPNTLP